MKISVQISTFNRAPILKEVLLSLNNQTLSKDLFEVIVINDGSTDNTIEIIEEIKKKVSYKLVIINQDNLGLPIARNKGILNTKCDIILFIDDDVLADKNLLLEHYKTHLKKEDTVVRGWVNHIDKLEIPSKPIFKLADFSTSFFWTSNVSVSRKNLIKAGLFYEKFYKYGWEDIEMGNKLRKLGLKLIINNKAIGYHYKPLPSFINLEKALEIETKRAISAKIYYNLYKSLRVKMATGYYFPPKNLYPLLYKTPIYNYIKSVVKNTKNKAVKGFLFNLLRKIHYYVSLNSNDQK